jgi:hypothetical protein
VKLGGLYLSKLDDCSTPTVFVGYEPGTKAWRFYNPVTRRAYVSRDAVFQEERAWNWNTAELGDDEPLKFEYINIYRARRTDVEPVHAPPGPAMPASRGPATLALSPASS